MNISNEQKTKNRHALRQFLSNIIIRKCKLNIIFLTVSTDIPTALVPETRAAEGY
jgi:hypothetical protein